MLKCGVSVGDEFLPTSKMNVGKNLSGSLTKKSSSGFNWPWKGLGKALNESIQTAIDNVSLKHYGGAEMDASKIK